LALDGHHEAIVRVRETGSKYLALNYLPTRFIYIAQRLTGKINEKLLCGLMLQYHRGSVGHLLLM
jgi:hypothetical protein